MTIQASLIKELRDRTGAGFMDCKKALIATNGDIEKAIEEMRKSGGMQAAKKAGRIAAEGLIVLMHSDDYKKAVILEINSETDFAARHEQFIQFCEDVAKCALQKSIPQVESLLAAMLPNQHTIEEERQTLVARVGENINIRRVALLKTEGIIGTYLHGKRIGVIVSVRGGDANLAHDIAMHIAASNPEVIQASDVSPERITKEREIFTAQAAESGKPADIIEKMIDGKIKKFMDDISLLGQAYIKDPSITVANLLKTTGASVDGFFRFEVGEGIEKKSNNFAEEVMAQVRGDA